MIDDIKKNLEVSFNTNPNLDASNIGSDNTFEDKVVTFATRMISSFNVNLDNLYEKMKTFQLRALSVYANGGFINYDSSSNIGYISPYILKNDDNNFFNVDNLITQLLLMVMTSKDNYYGFGNENELYALNEACSYIIASNLVGTAQKSYLEEEVNSLNQLDIILRGANAKMDFINAYFSNNGSALKEELNKYGISNDLLNEINYLYQAKLSKLNMPELYARIENKINKNFAILVSNQVINDEGIIDKYKSSLLGDNVFDYSSIGLDQVGNNTVLALNEIANRRVDNIYANQVMSKQA